MELTFLGGISGDFIDFKLGSEDDFDYGFSHLIAELT